MAMRGGGWAAGLLAAALLAPMAASAQFVETPIVATGSGAWSATAAHTAGDGNAVFQAEAGWPGVGFTYLHGANDRTDVGLHIGLNYGFEGTTATVAGVNLAVPYRRELGEIGGAMFTFRADPGLSIYGNKGALVSVGGPIGVVAGFRVDPRLTLDVGADIPVLISFSNPAGFLFGPQAGGGGEYLIDRNLALTLRARVGPAFALNSSGSGHQMAFTTLIGLAYRVGTP